MCYLCFHVLLLKDYLRWCRCGCEWSHCSGVFQACLHFDVGIHCGFVSSLLHLFNPLFRTSKLILLFTFLLRYGRRKLLIAGICTQGVALLIIMAYFAFNMNSNSLLITAMFIYVGGYQVIYTCLSFTYLIVKSVIVYICFRLVSALLRGCSSVRYSPYQWEEREWPSPYK